MIGKLLVNLRKPLSSTAAPTAIPRELIGSGSIVGIWRISDEVETTTRVDGDHQPRTYSAQPADALGSNRWDYHLTVGQDSTSFRVAFDAFVRAAATRHPNLIRVNDWSIDTTNPYIVTAAAEGCRWADRQEQTIQTLPVALWVIRQAAMAAAALHGAGWIHGRIDPAAILVRGDGTALLHDLSFASTIHSNRRLIHAARPPYASPEMIAGDHAAIPAMDIYSLGQTLFDSLRRTATGAHSRTVIQTADLIESMLDPVADRRPTAATVAGELLRLEMQSLSEHFGPHGLIAPLPLAA